VVIGKLAFADHLSLLRASQAHDFLFPPIVPPGLDYRCAQKTDAGEMDVDLRFEAGEGIQRFGCWYDEAEKDFLKK
jgi:hypothetical protein